MNQQVFTLRLVAENAILQDLKNGLLACPADEKYEKWIAVISGPEQSAWEGGQFLLEMNLCAGHTAEKYPFQHPDVRFVTRIYHPNVYVDGRICLDTIQNNWSPVIRIDTLLMTIQSLLTEPNTSSPANKEAAADYDWDRKKYNRKVRECVRDSLKQELPDDINSLFTFK